MRQILSSITHPTVSNYLTTDNPKLREHLGAVVAIMKLSTGYLDFLDKLDRLHPRYGDTLQLPFDYKREKDDGKGL